MLATLPAKARGQVFVEVDSMDEVRDLAAPGRVCVSWLARDRGRSLRTAVDAWLAEMLPVDLDREHRVYAWISGEPAARVISERVAARGFGSRPALARVAAELEPRADLEAVRRRLRARRDVQRR